MVNEAVWRKKDAHKAMCQNNTEDNTHSSSLRYLVREATASVLHLARSVAALRAMSRLRRHQGMKNKAKKAVSKAIREKVEEALTELKN